jgi:hypothetical protein
LLAPRLPVRSGGGEGSGRRRVRRSRPGRCAPI